MSSCSARVQSHRDPTTRGSQTWQPGAEPGTGCARVHVRACASVSVSRCRTGCEHVCAHAHLFLHRRAAQGARTHICFCISVWDGVRACARGCAHACLFLLSSCLSVHAHACSHAGRARRRPHQLDDVGDAEPVGWLDVLASFHEALVALEPSSTGMRPAPAARKHRLTRAGHWEPGQTPSGRKQAQGPGSARGHRLSGERPGDTSARLARLFVTERDTQQRARVIGGPRGEFVSRAQVTELDQRQEPSAQQPTGFPGPSPPRGPRGPASCGRG